MVSEASGAAVAQAAQPMAAEQSWPARGVAYYGLTVIIFATALNFMDLQQHAGPRTSRPIFT